MLCKNLQVQTSKISYSEVGYAKFIFFKFISVFVINTSDVFSLQFKLFSLFKPLFYVISLLGIFKKMLG